MKNEGGLYKEQQKHQDGQQDRDPLVKGTLFGEMIVADGAELRFGIYVHGTGRTFFCLLFLNHIILKWIYERSKII